MGHGRRGRTIVRIMLAGMLFGLAAVAVGSAFLVTDSSGARLQLAPVFVGAALAVAAAWLFRSGTRCTRG